MKMVSMMMTPPSRNDRLSATALSNRSQCVRQRVAQHYARRAGHLPASPSRHRTNPACRSARSGACAPFGAAATKLNDTTGIAKLRKSLRNRHGHRGYRRQRGQPVQLDREQQHRQGCHQELQRTETTPTVTRLVMRSYSDPRFTAAVIPSASASGTENAAVSAASSREFGSRLPIRVVTGRWLTSDRPGSPHSSPPSHSK